MATQLCWAPRADTAGGEGGGEQGGPGPWQAQDAAKIWAAGGYRMQPLPHGRRLQTLAQGPVLHPHTSRQRRSSKPARTSAANQARTRGHHQGGAGGLGERAKQIGAHAGNVAHVVAHVICRAAGEHGRARRKRGALQNSSCTGDCCRNCAAAAAPAHKGDGGCRDAAQARALAARAPAIAAGLRVALRPPVPALIHSRPATIPHTSAGCAPAITAGLRGSSSGMSFSTLPTRSAPTSAACRRGAEGGAAA